ncbi:MAG: metal ABC transporter permease [Planctomycetota bacterium]
MDPLRDLLHYFPQALVGGLLIAVTCSVLGVFVILKRVVFIGIVLSEVAALGVAAALAFNFQPFIGASILTIACVLILALPLNSDRIPRDALLGILFVAASSLSILLVARSGFGLEEVKNLLYGDIIFTTGTDLWIILGVMLPVLGFLMMFIRPIFYTFLDPDGARVLGIWTRMWELLFFFALGLCVAAASKTAGALLVFCFLVVAPSGGLVLGRKLSAVTIISVTVAATSTLAGMLIAVAKDTPTNQSIAVVACMGFVLCFVIAIIRKTLFVMRSHQNQVRS